MNKDDLQKLAEIAEKSSVWKPADVTEEPETKLINWQVYKVFIKDLGQQTLHFNGYTIGKFSEGRVCSPVTTFDKNTMRGVTRSGRVYELIGKPGFHRDAEYVWNRWLAMNGDPEHTCITNEFWENNDE